MSTQLQEHMNGNPAALAGFESTAIGHVQDREVGAVSAAAREESELKGAIFLARQYPRDEFKAYNKIMKTCGRPGFAEEAIYSFPRSGQTVKGPSVQMAREIARCWGNIRYGLRIVSVDDETVHIKGYAYDMESNGYVEAEDKFEKLVYRKKGGWVKPDERDLRELINRRGAILVRNAILQVVPSDVTDNAVQEVERTLHKAAAGEIQQRPEEAIRRLVKAFDGIGVTTDMLVAYLKHSLEAITAEEIADLRGVFKSIQDGNSRREEYFDLQAASRATQELNDELGDSEKAMDKKESPKAKKDEKTSSKSPSEEPIDYDSWDRDDKKEPEEGKLI